MRTALVTGACRGIGQSICEKLLKRKYKVYACHRWEDDDPTEFILSNRDNPNIKFYDFDLSKKKNIKEFITVIKHVKFDLVVNNAGDIIFEEFEDISLDNWDYILKVNLFAPFYISIYLKNNIKSGGSIINIASTDGDTGTFSSISYSVSKAALINLTKSLANNFGSRKVRVNSISPGWINTNMSNNASLEAANLTPLQRNGTPKEVAHLVLFLSSKQAAFINGANIIIDGGYTNVDWIMLKESKTIV